MKYEVIADRDKGDDPKPPQIEVGDRITYGTRAHGDDGKATFDRLVRIERPVPTTAADELLAAGEFQDPHPLTREQIAEAIEVADDEWMNDVHPNSTDRDWRLHLADAVLALIGGNADA